MLAKSIALKKKKMEERVFIFTNDYICLITIFLLKITYFNKIVIYMLLRT